MCLLCLYLSEVEKKRGRQKQKWLHYQYNSAMLTVNKLTLVVKRKVNKMKANPPRMFDVKRLAANPGIQVAIIQGLDQTRPRRRTALEDAEGRPVENCGGDYWL